MKKNFVGVALGLFSVALYAADVKVTPPNGGGFSVNSSSGTSVFRVDAGRGTVYIKNLPAELGSVPLCWNATTGELSPCAGGASLGDTTPPTITTTAPAVAPSQYFSYDVTCEDDVELRVCGGPVFPTPDLGVKNKTNSVDVTVPLGGAWTQMLVATDMAGNSKKHKVVIQGAETGIALKTFSTISPATIPTGFDCSVDDAYSSIDGIQLTQVSTSEPTYLSGYSGWSPADGYILSLSVSGVVGSGSSPQIFLRSDGAQNLFGSAGPLRTPLAATSVQIPRSISRSGSGSSGSYAVGYSGDIQYDSAADEIVIDVVMECGAAPSGSPLVWTQGASMRITARP